MRFLQYYQKPVYGTFLIFCMKLQQHNKPKMGLKWSFLKITEMEAWYVSKKSCFGLLADETILISRKFIPFFFLL